MSTIKEAMQQIIARQPDDGSYDEILRKLVFDRMVQRRTGGFCRRSYLLRSRSQREISQISPRRPKAQPRLRTMGG